MNEQEQWQLFNLDPDSNEGKWAQEVYDKVTATLPEESSLEELIEAYKTMLGVDELSDEVLEKLHLSFSLGYFICYGLMQNQQESKTMEMIEQLFNEVMKDG